MIAVALKGLAGRKVRALLTAFAVVLGVSMVSGTFILTDTMQRSFNDLFSASYDGTDAVVKGREIVKNSTNDSQATVPASLLDKVRALPEVAEAGGSVWPNEASSADIIGPDGKATAQESAGMSYDPAHPRFSPLELRSGRWARGPGEVVIDAGTASKQHYDLGDAVTIGTAGGRHRYRVTGTVSFGGVDSLGFSSIAAWDVRTAQSLLGREGRFDQVSIAAKPGTSRADLVRAVQPLVPSALQVKDAGQQADDDAARIDKSMNKIRLFLLAFGAIALLVGAFVILNTLSITVAQRTRELATLRTLGASRRQVLRSVVIEGAVLGAIASVLGLGLGFGVARGMVALFGALGVDLPETAAVVAPRTVVVSLLLGTVVTVVASVLPARRATRVPPIAAVREGATLPASRLEAHSLRTGAGLAIASVAAMTLGVVGGLGGAAVGLLLGLGVIGLFTGVALAAPHLVSPLTRVVGWPGRAAAGVVGELAGANSVRNPRRTASTAAALMIGLSLVTAVAVLGAGLRSSTEAAVKDQLRAHHVIDGKQGLPFRSDEGDRLARVPGVTAASHVRSDKALVRGEELDVGAVDPATIGRFYRFDWAKGSEQALGRLGTDGVLLRGDYADRESLRLGERVAITTPSGAKRTLVVRGIYDAPQTNALLADVVMSQRTFDDAFTASKNSYTFLDAEPGAGKRIEAAASELTDLEYHTGAAFPKDATKDTATFLAMLYVLLGFSIVVSLFGMVNTMVLSVFERTREIGLLRTIGMTPRQARRMVRHESVITALIGATLGVGLGLVLAALVTGALADYDLSFTVPVPALAVIAIVAALAGVAAAIAPARRAARLKVLDALHYE